MEPGERFDGGPAGWEGGRLAAARRPHRNGRSSRPLRWRTRSLEKSSADPSTTVSLANPGVSASRVRPPRGLSCGLARMRQRCGMGDPGGVVDVAVIVAGASVADLRAVVDSTPLFGSVVSRIEAGTRAKGRRGARFVAHAGSESHATALRCSSVKPPKRVRLRGQIVALDTRIAGREVRWSRPRRVDLELRRGVGLVELGGSRGWNADV